MLPTPTLTRLADCQKIILYCEKWRVRDFSRAIWYRCAARAPEPIPAVEPQDQLMGRRARIVVEIEAGTQKVQALASIEQGAKAAHNVAASHNSGLLH